MTRLHRSRRTTEVESDPEAARIALYERVQRDACAVAGAAFVEPDYEKLVMIAPVIVAGHRRVYGQRLPETATSSGWAFTADDQERPAVDEMQFEHLRHLVTVREDLMAYLGLPVGWTFAILEDGSWIAWSPEDRLLTWIEDFTAGTDATAAMASAIAALIEEHFGDTDLLERAAVRLREWAAAGARPASDVHDTLREAAEWLRAHPRR